MSVNIQDCSSLTAAQRRDARKARILGNEAARLSKLMGVSPSEDASTDSTSFVSTNEIATSEGLPSAATAPASKSASDLNQTAPLDFIEPDYADSIAVCRVEICISFGIMICLMANFSEGFPVFPVLIAFSLGWHVMNSFREAKKFPKHGYIVNFLLAGGYNETLVRSTGFAADISWNVITDILLALTGFIFAIFVITGVSALVSVKVD